MVSIQNDTPWHAAYPPPKNKNPASITKDELLQHFKEGKEPGRDFILVDLRRNDYEGGTIRGSINLPAQSLYPTLPALYTLLKSAHISKVIWYCGSSRGRGSRAATWFADYIEEQGDQSMQSMTLAEGIKGWATAGPEYTAHMLEYSSKIWEEI